MAIKLPPKDFRWELYKAQAAARGIITDVQAKPTEKAKKAA